MKTTPTAKEKLISFINQRPGLDYSNYGEPRSYRKEMREITADRNDFFELLAYAEIWADDLNALIEKELKASSGRLTMNEGGNLEYCTGQYFPTEYRPAANRLLANIIWKCMRESNGGNDFKDGHEMRASVKRRLSRRVFKYYFN